MPYPVMTKSEAIAYINRHVDSLNYEISEVFALRGDDHIPTNHFPKSHAWIDNVRQSTTLPGLCAVLIAQNGIGDNSIDNLPDVSMYGANVFLLRGERINLDNTEDDPGEIVLHNHKIIAIVKD